MAATTQQHNILVNLIANVKDFSKAMANPIDRVKEITSSTGKLSKRFKENRSVMGRFATRVRLATHGLRGFRMEMLGVMFFGMAMSRMFKGLLNPALRMTGIFDLLSNVLGLVFLPIVLTLLPFILKISDYLLGLSEKTKLVMGWFVLAGIAIGTFLFVFGTLALGIGSIILVFGGLLAVLLSVGASFVKYLGPLGKYAAAITVFGTVVPGVKAFNDGLSEQDGWWSKLKDSVKEFFTAILGEDSLSKVAEVFGDDLAKDIKKPFEELKGTFKGMSDKFTIEWTRISTILSLFYKQQKESLKDWWNNILGEDGKERLGLLTEMFDALKTMTELWVEALVMLKPLMEKIVETWNGLNLSGKRGVLFGALVGGGVDGKRGFVIGAIAGGAAGHFGSVAEDFERDLIQKAWPTPLHRGGFEATFNINTPSDLDERALMDRISAWIVENLNNLERTRGTY